MTHIMGNVFHPCNSFEYMTGFMGIDRLTICCAVTHMSHMMDLKYCLTYEF